MLFPLLTVLFLIVSVAMVLIVLVQRPQGGGLAGAFGGAGGGGGDTVFGGRVGDALTWMTVIAFVLYLLFAVGLNLAPISPERAIEIQPAGSLTAPLTEDGGTGAAPTGGDVDPATAPTFSPPADTEGGNGEGAGG